MPVWGGPSRGAKAGSARLPGGMSTPGMPAVVQPRDGARPAVSSHSAPARQSLIDYETAALNRDAAQRKLHGSGKTTDEPLVEVEGPA
jgi:hypothetical protein